MAREEWHRRNGTVGMAKKESKKKWHKRNAKGNGNERMQGRNAQKECKKECTKGMTREEWHRGYRRIGERFKSGSRRG